MLAKMTSKNQLTLPKAVVRDFADVTHFDVQAEGERIVLTPVRLGQVDAVRAKLRDLGIRPDDVARAVKWARRAK
ncbi:MAG: hypothetical protein K1X53_12105 [Candidatus Sumerlaeaceae bacterium]|nr:hypothetical protein [Candidatus Sumerlaeaceae bacterium]